MKLRLLVEIQREWYRVWILPQLGFHALEIEEIAGYVKLE